LVLDEPRSIKRAALNSIMLCLRQQSAVLVIFD